MPEPSKPEPTCPKCGYSVLPEWTICTKCGNVLSPSPLLPTIERLEGLMAKATQGEWKYIREHPWGRATAHIVWKEGGPGRGAIADTSPHCVHSEEDEHTAELIAALHNAFPELAAGVRQLLRIIDVAERIGRGEDVSEPQPHHPLWSKLAGDRLSMRDMGESLREKDAELARLAGEVERLNRECEAFVKGNTRNLLEITRQDAELSRLRREIEVLRRLLKGPHRFWTDSDIDLNLKHQPPSERQGEQG
jgi:hypothetical protein